MACVVARKYRALKTTAWLPMSLASWLQFGEHGTYLYARL